MKRKLFKQSICPDCLQSIVNGDNERDEEEKMKMAETLDKWSKTGYHPYGLTDNTEPSFSWQRCDLCHSLPGDRYEYYFCQKKPYKTHLL